MSQGQMLLIFLQGVRSNPVRKTSYNMCRDVSTIQTKDSSVLLNFSVIKNLRLTLLVYSWYMTSLNPLVASLLPPSVSNSVIMYQVLPTVAEKLVSHTRDTFSRPFLCLVNVYWSRSPCIICQNTQASEILGTRFSLGGASRASHVCSLFGCYFI